MNIQREIARGNEFLKEINDAKNLKIGRKPNSKFNYLKWQVIGSAGYLPAEQCHDVDFLVMVFGGTWEDFAAEYLENSEIEKCGDEEYSGDGEAFSAFREGNINYIVTDDWGFYQRYVAAYNVCKALHITDKQTRVVVHHLVRDNATIEEAILEGAKFAPAEVVKKDSASALTIVAPILNAYARRQNWGAH